MTEPLRSVNNTDRQRASRAIIGWLLGDDLAVDTLLLEVSESRGEHDPHVWILLLMALVETGGVLASYVWEGDRKAAAEWMQAGLLHLVAQQENDE